MYTYVHTPSFLRQVTAEDGEGEAEEVSGPGKKKKKKKRKRGSGGGGGAEDSVLVNVLFPEVTYNGMCVCVCVCMCMYV